MIQANLPVALSQAASSGFRLYFKTVRTDSTDSIKRHVDPLTRAVRPDDDADPDRSRGVGIAAANISCSWKWDACFLLRLSSESGACWAICRSPFVALGVS